MRKLIGYIIFCFLFFGCKKDGVHKKDPFYFKGTINGKSIHWTAPFVDFGSSEQPQFQTAMPTQAGSMPLFGCYSNELRYQLKEGTSIYEHHTTGSNFSNNISVYFVHSTNGFTTADAMRSWFTNGTKSFGLYREVCSDPVLDGIVVTYVDPNGEIWVSTANNQSSNSFEQVSLLDETRTQKHSKKWTARFSCRLYDKNGNFIDLVNCEIYGPVFPI